MKKYKLAMKSVLTHMKNFTISVNAGIGYIGIKTNNKTQLNILTEFKLTCHRWGQGTHSVELSLKCCSLCSLLLSYLQCDWIFISICWHKLSNSSLHKLLSVYFQLITFDSGHRNPVNKLAYPAKNRVNVLTFRF